MVYKFEIKYGFWMAFTGFIWLLTERIIGVQDTYLEYRPLSSVLFSIPIAIGLFLMMFNKARLENYSLKYMLLLKSGSITTVAGATLYLIFSYAFFTIVNPNYSQIMVDLSIQKNNLPAEKLEDFRKLAEASFAPSSLAMQSFAFFIMTGILLSLILPLFVSRKNAKS